MLVEEIINLLDDPDFKLWALLPKETKNGAWNQVIENQPDRAESILKARLIMQALDKEFQTDLPDQKTIEHMLRRIFAQNH